jgi:hypothetical protein
MGQGRERQIDRHPSFLGEMKIFQKHLKNLSLLIRLE